MHNKPTDNFLLLNHCPVNSKNNSLIKTTLNVPRREGNSMLKEEHIDSITTPLITKTITGSERPDISHATVIKEEHFPLSNYQHLYTSAFLSTNNSENTTVVKISDDTFLHSFTNLKSDRLNQPHLEENTPTNNIVERRAVEIHEKSTLNSHQNVNLNAAYSNNSDIDSEICHTANEIITDNNNFPLMPYMSTLFLWLERTA
jgi:hypothetical protein